MSKIAIITYSRACNYGSALQTYALNFYLTSKGNKVCTIDYANDKQQKLYTIFEPTKSLMSIARNLQSLFYYKKIKHHISKFNNFLREKVPMTSRVMCSRDFEVLNNEFDYFICGSDQIWNVECDDFDTNYMLSFVHDKNKCIAYAPSLGAGVTNPLSKKIISDNVKDFKALSTREKFSCDIVAEATNRDVMNVLDPVFLLNTNEWSEFSDKSPIEGEYILGYFIGDVDGMREYAAKLSSKTGYPVVVIYKSLRDVMYNFRLFYEAGPEDFVALVKNAKYVVTNSFHAISFSLIFGISFWAFVHPNSADERIVSILSLVGLKERIVGKNNINMVDPLLKIDYSSINKANIENMVDVSKMYLMKNIKHESM